MNARIRLLGLSAATALLLASCSRSEWPLASPGRGLVVKVFQRVAEESPSESGRLFFRVELNGREVLGDSPLGVRQAGKEFAAGLVFVGREDERIEETYPMVAGKKSIHRHVASQMTLTFKNPNGGIIRLVFRAADDGVAFRYDLRGDGNTGNFEELSGFRLPGKAVGWLQDYRPNYEGPYVRTTAASKTGVRDIGFPALFEVPGAGWVLLSEASVYGDDAGARLSGSLDPPFLFRVKLQETDRPLPLRTPWRVAIVGAGLGTIVESVLIESLNPPSEIADTSWIVPGRVAFPWWSDHFANGKPETLRAFVDLAAEMGWEWLEFDLPLIGSAYDPIPGWRNTPWIPELVAYAFSKGVRCYGWESWQNLDTPDKRGDVLGLYEKLDLRGIKVDYCDSDSREMMKLREDIIRDCASRRMMGSFHGETVPRGQRRRFPNVMTLEAVKGAEWYTLPEFGDFKGAPIHNCTLPFTRNVVGPMDYTPVAFSASNRETTDAHELALPVIFESGWTCIADRPDAIRASPGKDILKCVPAAWDDIRFLGGYPGEYVCLARRKGNDWFVAGINANQARVVELPTAFLGNGTFAIRLYKDGAGGRIRVEELSVKAGIPLRLEMPANGGFCTIISIR